MSPSTLLRRLLPAAVLLLGLVALFGLVASTSAEEPPVTPAAIDLSADLPVDPAIAKIGTLENGLEYWIRPHAMPRNKVSLFLHIGSGSLQEDENQRGLAHFLEHMAFNGSKHFPPGEMVKYFESLGMRFGQHQNAFTSFDQTTYVLSLPDTKGKTIERALLFFSDVAHELSILPEEVDKERGVIAEEARARGGVNTRMMKRVLPMILPGSRLSRRIPIGDMEVVRTAPAERLRAYYEKWYRPDLTTLLVVGDVTVKEVEPLIEKAFAGWKKPDAPAPTIGSGMQPFTSVQAGVLTDPDQTNVEATAQLLRRARRMRTARDFRNSLIEDLGRHIMQRRLRVISQENRGSYLLANVSGGQNLTGYEMLGYDATSPPDRWREAFYQVTVEMERARVHGFGSKELGRARAAILAGLGQMAESMGSVPASVMGQLMNAAVTEQRRPMSVQQRKALAEALLPDITAEEVSSAFRTLYDPGKVFLVLTYPEREGLEVPTRESFLGLYRRALATKVEKQAERDDIGRILEKDPEPGEVTARVEDKELGVTSLTMSNGARVHIKPLPAVNRINVQVRLYGGEMHETAETRGLSEAAAVAFTRTRIATQGLKPVEVAQYLASRQIEVSGGSDKISLELGVSGPKKDLEDGLRLVWLLLTEPRVDSTALSAWKQQVATRLKRFRTSAPWRALNALQMAASSNDPRFTMLTLEQALSIKRHKAQAWLDHIITTAPIEVVIAGGIDAEEGERLAKQWFGSLPRRAQSFSELLTLRKVASPKGPLKRLVSVESVTDQAFVLLGWRGVPIRDVAGQIHLQHAATMLTTRLINAVREERGLTYAVQASYESGDYDGMDGMTVQFTADPAKAAEAAKVARETVLAFARTGPTEKEVLATEAQMENVLSAGMQQTSFWTSILDQTYGDGHTLSDVKGFLSDLKTVDKDKMLETLRAVLVDERFIQIISAP